MIRSFKNLPCNPWEMVLLPTAMFVTDTAGIYDPVCVNEICPRLKKAAFEEGVGAIDLSRVQGSTRSENMGSKKLK